MDLFRNNKELQFGTCGLMANHTLVQRMKERNSLLKKINKRECSERLLLTKSPLEEIGSLKYSGFSLAEL